MTIYIRDKPFECAVNILYLPQVYLERWRRRGSLRWSVLMALTCGIMVVVVGPTSVAWCRQFRCRAISTSSLVSAMSPRN